MRRLQKGLQMATLRGAQHLEQAAYQGTKRFVAPLNSQLTLY